MLRARLVQSKQMTAITPFATPIVNSHSEFDPLEEVILLRYDIEVSSNNISVECNGYTLGDSGQARRSYHSRVARDRKGGMLLNLFLMLLNFIVAMRFSPSIKQNNITGMLRIKYLLLSYTDLNVFDCVVRATGLANEVVGYVQDQGGPAFRRGSSHERSYLSCLYSPIICIIAPYYFYPTKDFDMIKRPVLIIK